jgi:murein DD-endopeptidase MepM/ murein hydrolase activator NlpD
MQPITNRIQLGLAFFLFLAILPHSPAAMSFESPLSGTAGSDWFIINFKDNGDGVTPLDYAGGQQTYATHTGIDIMLYDYLTMDQGINVLVAAPGTVIAYLDGLDDRLLESQPNKIFVQHADGSVSYYAHLKMNSLMVHTGQVVAAGEKMAEVGGDGTNEVSHLHFGVRDQYSTNGIWCDIMTNQLGLSQNFDWFDNYTNQVIRHVYGMGVTITNDPVFSLPAWRQQQTPSSYSLMHSGPFLIWIKYTGRNTNDFLGIRLLSQSGLGATIDFTSCGWYPPTYVIYHCLQWYSSWLNASLSNGTTYKLQYNWNGGDWQDGPGNNTFSVADELQEVYLSRISLPAYSNAPTAPASLEASEGTHSAGVRLTWTPSANTVRYNVLRNTSDDAGSASLIVRTSNSGYDDTNTTPETIYYYRVASVNPGGTSSVSAAAYGWRAEPAGTGPEVRINNRRQPFEIGSGETVMVTVQMAPGNFAGIDADWWLLANTPVGWYIFTEGGWMSLAGGLHPAYQGPLFNLPAYSVLQSDNLPTGEYTFYFGVDERDGLLDENTIWFSSASFLIR